jgi:hypothetical protein
MAKQMNRTFVLQMNNTNERCRVNGKFIPSSSTLIKSRCLLHYVVVCYIVQLLYIYIVIRVDELGISPSEQQNLPSKKVFDVIWSQLFSAVFTVLLLTRVIQEAECARDRLSQIS